MTENTNNLPLFNISYDNLVKEAQKEQEKIKNRESMYRFILFFIMFVTVLWTSLLGYIAYKVFKYLV